MYTSLSRKDRYSPEGIGESAGAVLASHTAKTTPPSQVMEALGQDRSKVFPPLAAHLHADSPVPKLAHNRWPESLVLGLKRRNPGLAIAS